MLWQAALILTNGRVIFVLIILALTVAAYLAFGTEWTAVDAPTQADLERWVGAVGIFGPLAIIGLMSVAVVVSPLPSAPIALTSGALYGHGWGTLYVLIGAEIGALAAFTIARWLGRDIVMRWVGNRLPPLAGSQTALMLIVFFSRLLPFLSFDLVSYAAGLTSLAWWRFALATAGGIVPASFVLAHLGGEMADADAGWILTAVGVLGLLTALPILVRALLKGRPQRTERESRDRVLSRDRIVGRVRRMHITMRGLAVVTLCTVLIGAAATAIAATSTSTAPDRMTGGAVCTDCGPSGSLNVGPLDRSADHGATDQHGRGNICGAIACTPVLLSDPSGIVPIPERLRILPHVDDGWSDAPHSRSYRPPRLSA